MYVCIYTAKLHLMTISDHLVNKAILCVCPISDPINDMYLTVMLPCIQANKRGFKLYAYYNYVHKHLECNI